jgi:hypothetical protein
MIAVMFVSNQKLETIVVMMWGARRLVSGKGNPFLKTHPYSAGGRSRYALKPGCKGTHRVVPVI